MTEAILESISDGVFTVDASWHITFFNKSAERITGVKRMDALGKLCHEVFRSNMCETECPLRRTMKSGKPIIDKKGFCVGLNGERIPISVSTALLLDKEGKIQGATETFRDLREIEILKERLQEQSSIEGYTSKNPDLRRTLDLLPVIAESNSSVLICGETGTGKEVTARMIHRLSDRSKAAFIAVNCAALPDTLLESELFGYKKGAFTGADRDRDGRFKRAQNGTLFLDEIGDISPALQVKLLRVLQEHEFEALGSVKSEKTNARIICATNKNLEQLVEQGLFRQDLYYRIKIISIMLPPLRERKEDIPQLAERFLRMYTENTSKNILRFSPAVYTYFYTYRWPGNIRELQNTIERAVVLCRAKEIDPSLLPAELLDSVNKLYEEPGKTVLKGSDLDKNKENTTDLRTHIQNFERSLLLEMLRKCDTNCTKAAYKLGIDKASLYRKIKQHGIDLDSLRHS